MGMRSTLSPEQRAGSSEWTNKYLQDQTARAPIGLLGWWYRLTAPAIPPANASFTQRELARRGRLASTIAFFLVLVLIAVEPIGILSENRYVNISTTVMLLLVFLALGFNRHGRSNVTGLILAAGINLALIGVIRMSPKGLDPSSLGLFDLLVFSEVFVASLLPVNWVFAAALFDIAFIVFDILTQQPRTPAFASIMATSGYAVILRPVLLHTIVTVVLWLWVRSATLAIARADRAEVIAQLEHTLAEQEHAVAQQKRQLDASIQQIVETHVRVANGDFSARVPLTSDNVLWPIAGALNNLLSRVQRLRQFEQEMRSVLPQIQYLRQEARELQKIKEEIPHIVEALHGARLGHYPVQLGRSGTHLDMLLTEINLLCRPSLPLQRAPASTFQENGDLHHNTAREPS